MKTMKELWQQRCRLFESVERNPKYAKFVAHDGGYYTLNEEGAKRTRRIANAYHREKKRIVDALIESGQITEESIMRDFIVYDGIRQNVRARDYAVAFANYQDLRPKTRNRNASEATVSELLGGCRKGFLDRIGWTARDTEELTEFVETL